MNENSVMFKLTAEKYNITGVAALQCDVCGREISGKPHRVIIEGAKLTTCAQCAKSGSGEWKPKPKSLRAPPKTASASMRQFKPRWTKRSSREIREDLTVIENFGSIIRKARQESNLSQEDLGRMIGEKVSVIRKIEVERIMPSERLARKLEHALGVKLLVPLVEPEVSPSLYKANKGITLGEIVYLKDSRRRQLQDEGDNSR